MFLKKFFFYSVVFLALAGSGASPAGAGKEARFTVQVETVSFEPAAGAVVNRLSARGYDAYFETCTSAGGKPFYKVRFGRFTTRAEASVAARAYKKQEQRDCFVVQTMPGTAQADQASDPRSAKPDISGSARAAEPAVKVLPAPEPPEGAESFFTVQVCVCVKVLSAERHADSLRAMGFEPYIVTHETSKGKILYRVRMGAFNERAGAVELARAYEQKGGRDFIIVRSGQGSAPQKMTESPVAPLVPELIHPESITRVFPQEPDSIQEAPISEDEPVSAGNVQPESASANIAPDANLEGTGTVSGGSQVSSKRQAAQKVQVTKIYAYTGSGNELNLTNAYATIPKDLLGRIKYVSIFPVMFSAVPEKGSALEMEIEGERRLLRLKGLRLPEEKRAIVSDGIRQVMTAELLRLKYHPDDDRKEMMCGTLYYRSGADLQIELLKRGLALVDEETAPVDRQESLRAAQQRARQLEAGIWSTQGD